MVRAHEVCPPIRHAHACVTTRHGLRRSHHLCGRCAQTRCSSDAASGTITSAAAPAVAMAPPCVSFAVFPCGCGWVPRSREVCSVCGQNGFGRSGERAFASLGVQGCAGRPYGPPTAISSYCPCVYGRSCCPRMSNAGSSVRMLGGVNETRFWCEYRL